MGRSCYNVRSVFRPFYGGMHMKGNGTNRIGKVLYERKIPKPGYYRQEFFSQHDTGRDDYWYGWKQEVIMRLSLKRYGSK